MQTKVLAAAATLLLSAPVWAEPDINNVTVDVDSNNGSRGGSFSHRDIDAHEFSVNPGFASGPGYEKTSFSLDLDWLHRIHPIVQIGTELGYLFGSKLDGDVPARVLGPVAGSADHLSVSGDVDARVLHLTPEIKVGPKFETPGGYLFQVFAMGGGGLYWTHYTHGTLNLTGNGYSNTPYNFDGGNDYNGGWNVGGGVAFSFPGQYSVGFDVRYHRLVYSGDNNDISYVIPSLRLSLFF